MENKPICCGYIELMNIKWMFLDDGRRCMPYINAISTKVLYRVNYCPSCGKDVRSAILDHNHKIE